MKTQVKEAPSYASFDLARIRSMVDMLVKNSYEENPENWQLSNPLNFNMYVEQKAKKGYGKVRYKVFVKDKYEVKLVTHNEDVIKFQARRIKEDKNESNS